MRTPYALAIAGEGHDINCLAIDKEFAFHALSFYINLSVTWLKDLDVTLLCWRRIPRYFPKSPVKETTKSINNFLHSRMVYILRKINIGLFLANFLSLTQTKSLKASINNLNLTHWGLHKNKKDHQQNMNK